MPTQDLPESEVAQRFARNNAGRDFAVGDIHGCFDQLQVALENVHINLFQWIVSGNGRKRPCPNE